MPPTFDEWKRLLIESAGSAGAPVHRLGNHVLQLFWQDGCEPTMGAMLDYAQAGLCRNYDRHEAATESPLSLRDRTSIRGA
jgi:hypothetical protein